MSFEDTNVSSFLSVLPLKLQRYRGTLLMRNTPLLGPYSRTTSRVHVGPRGGGLFLMREVLLQRVRHSPSPSAAAGAPRKQRVSTRGSQPVVGTKTVELRGEERTISSG